MKTSLLLIATLVFTGVKVIAQEPAQTTKVRIKKTEYVNGKTRNTDTVYTISGPVKIDEIPEIPQIEIQDLPGKKKIVIITDEIRGDHQKEVNITEEMDEQMERALKAAGVDGKVLGVDAVVVINDDGEKKGEQRTARKIVVVKTIKLVAPEKTENEMLERTTGFNDGKLEMNEMKFYPNPGDGRFNLSFTLKEKGDTRIQVLNSEGKAVFTEQLYEFTGAYDKQLDISEFPSGVYFVRVEQNDHAQVKKMVLE